MMDTINNICETKKRLAEYLESETKDVKCLADPGMLEAAGEIAKVIRALADAEKNCWESLYYKTVIDAMYDGQEERYGYNHRHLASGRFASKGSGHMVGYHHAEQPYMDQHPYIEAYLHDPGMMGQHMHDGRVGYDHMQVTKTLDSIKEMYQSSDPQHQKEVKEDLLKLVGEM